MLEHRCPVVWSFNNVIRVHCLGLVIGFLGCGFGFFFLKSLVQINAHLPSVPLKFHPRF